MPWHLRGSTGPAWLAMAETQRRSVEHIKEHCPEGFSKFWLESITDFELPTTALCPKCDGYFARPIDEPWKKICLGCYLNNTPTSYTREQILAAGIVEPWLMAETDVP